MVLRVVLSFCFCSLFIFAQQKFPYGTFSSSQPDPNSTWVWHNNFTQIKDLGVNFIIHRLDQLNKTAIAGQDFNVIAHNTMGDSDFVNHFSAGANTRYKLVDAPPSDGYTEYIQISKGDINGSGIWVLNETLDDSGQAISYGPNATQYHKYVRNYDPEFIQFSTVWDMKMEGDTTQANDSICEISVEYRNSSNEYIVLATKVIKVSDLNSLSYTQITLDYNLSEVTDYTGELPRYSDGPDLEPSPAEENYSESPTLASGIHYRLNYYSRRNLHVKSIECFDKGVWKYFFRDFPTQFTNKLDSQTVSFQSYTNLTHWMTIQEPHSLDQYRPISVLNDALLARNRQPPITLFYPGWNGARNGHDAFKQFRDSVNPSQMLFYYFPFWQTDVATPYTDSLLSVFWFLGDRLFDAHKYFPGYFYSAQSEAFIDERSPTPIWRWRKPEYRELAATMFLALATGTKGLVLESYYSYPVFSSFPYTQGYLPRCEGLVYNLQSNPNEFITTQLYDDLKEYFKPRINGLLGDKLTQLEFNGAMLRKRKLASGTFDHNDLLVHGTTAQRLAMSAVDTVASQNHMHHVGFFNDAVDTVNHRYFFLVNLKPKMNADSVRHIRLSFNIPDTNTFRDYRFRNVEGGYSINFRDSISVVQSILGGDGRLYEVLPTLRYGGILSSTDTVKYSETLHEDLEVPLGKTIHVKNNYYINAILHADSGSYIIHDGYSGYSYLDTAGQFTVTHWSNALLKSRNGSQPRLIWAAYPGSDSVISYKIYRKKNSPTFDLLATVTGSTTSYIDSATIILDNPGSPYQSTSDYYVTVTVASGGGKTKTFTSNTIYYNRVHGIIPDKEGQGSDIVKKFTYSLEQNYPNPFNPETVIRYSIEKPGLTLIRIYNVSGQLLKELVNEVQGAGEYSVTYLPGKNQASGIYFYELVSGTYRMTRKALYMK